MPEGRAIVTQALALALAAVVAQGADAVADTKSAKIVLSIYSYGGASAARVAPEIDSQERYYRNYTGPLTDVVSTPPLATSFPSVPKTPKGTSPDPPMVPLAPISPLPSPTTMEPSSSGGASGPPVLPVPQVVMVGWDASPLASVVGYQLYMGSVSGQYDTIQRVGNQTSAAIVIDRPVIYLAVSALTGDGLESPLSPELVVTVGQ